ncbi:hypothetical protein, partial [Nostoc sp.]
DGAVINADEASGATAAGETINPAAVLCSVTTNCAVTYRYDSVYATNAAAVTVETTGSICSVVTNSAITY